jgi:F-box/WD-40 domain protein MET30
LADDDLLWRRMCGQHIERKCVKCGWGLPLLERRRLRSELDHGAPTSTVGDLVHVDGEEGHVPVKVARSFGGEAPAGRSTNGAGGGGGAGDDPDGTPDHPGFSHNDHSTFPQLGTAAPRSAIPAYIASHPYDGGPTTTTTTSATTSNPLKRARDAVGSVSAGNKRIRRDGDISSSEGEGYDASSTHLTPINRSLEEQKLREEGAQLKQKRKPWKHVYCERLIVERNWRKGRCEIRTLKVGFYAR